MQDRDVKTKNPTIYTKLSLLWDFLKGSKTYFAISIIATLLVNAFDMLTPQIIRTTVDSIIGTADLDVPGLVERLDLIDPSPENYWSKTLPEINVRIHALPCVGDKLLIGGANDGTEDL